ncbi:MAG: FadR/GntR family transcriptional regulator [Thermomicrobiales bacterium]
MIDHTSKVAADAILRMLRQKGVGSQDMLEVRLMLECQAAALAAERATPTDIAAIVAVIDEMAAQPKPLEANVRLDFDFHLRVAEASHNLVLVAIMNAIRDLLYDTISATHTLDSRIGVRLSCHSAVLIGIRNHDAEAAQKAMQAHLEQTKYLVKIVEAGQSLEQEVKPEENVTG